MIRGGKKCRSIGQTYSLSGYCVIATIISLTIAQQAPPTKAATATETQATSTRTRTKQQSNVIDKLELQKEQANDLYLIGLFDIHLAGPLRQGLKCGPIDLDAGQTNSRRSMQNLEAFLWAIEQVNEDSSLLPGVRLRPLIIDTCSSFLRTNQQLANLLHGSETDNLQPASSLGSTGQQQGARRSRKNLVAVVADQHDWQSVEATIQLASSARLTTFVTQSRSSKMGEFVHKYQEKMWHQNEDHLGQQELRKSAASGSLVGGNKMVQVGDFLGELLGIGRMMPQPMIEADQVVNFGHQAVNFGPHQAAQPSSGGAKPEYGHDEEAQELEEQEGEQQSPELMVIKMSPSNELLADSIASLCDSMRWDLVSVLYDSDDAEMVDLHDELLRQFFARNIQLALDEQVGVQQMASHLAWEKLLTVLARKTQMGAHLVVSLLQTGSARSLLNELHSFRKKRKQITVNTTKESLEQLEEINSLLWLTISDREPFYSMATEALGTLAISSSSQLLGAFKSYFDSKQVGGQQTGRDNKEQDNRWWPEYLAAIYLKHKQDIGENLDSCLLRQSGIARFTQNSGPLLAHDEGGTILATSSTSQRQCTSLSLNKLLQFEQQNKLATKANATSGGGQAKRRDAQTHTTMAADRLLELNKYRAAGWEHNGMEIINSVLAIANGLESIRQALCQEGAKQAGLCTRMSLLMQAEQQQQLQPSEHSKGKNPFDFRDGLANVGEDNQQVSMQNGQQSEPAGGQMGQEVRGNQSVGEIWELASLLGRPFPSLSELLHSELMRSTFPLADGRVFSLMQIDNSQQQQQQQQQLQQQQLQAAMQLESKLKFYNLRFVRPNSIGFVKFAQYDPAAGGQSALYLNGPSGPIGATGGPSKVQQQQQQQQLAINSSKAVHYPEMLATIKQRQVPIERVSSTCSDERKCLMVNSFGKFLLADEQQQVQLAGQQQETVSGHGGESASAPGGQLMNEEELAAGLNSLFKLDHPLIKETEWANSSKGPTGEEEEATESHELAPVRVEVMRSQSQVSAWLPSAAGHADRQQPPMLESGPPRLSVQEPSGEAAKRVRFQLVAVMPLHARGHEQAEQSDQESNEARKTNKGDNKLPQCAATAPNSNPVAFIQLAALAYGQTMANNNELGLRAFLGARTGAETHQQVVEARQLFALAQGRQSDNKLGSGKLGDNKLGDINSSELRDSNSSNKSAINEHTNGQQSLVELSTRLIDHCDNLQLLQSGQLLSPSSTTKHDSLAKAETVVLFVDFDWPTSRRVEQLLQQATDPETRRQLHITIAPPNQLEAHPPTTSLPTSAGRASRTRSQFVQLVPSKENEIQALVRLLAATDWRLVHLIYTDSHEHRDHFLQRANELGICVSKLIWVPAPEAGSFQEAAGRLRQLFERELYDFSADFSERPTRDELNSDKTNSTQRPASSVWPHSDGLNSTRVLVVLGSADTKTNQLIGRAATETMRRDYVWVTSHEWLASMEEPEAPESSSDATPKQSSKLHTRQLLATKLDTTQTGHSLHEFAHFLAHLTPAIHSPLPTHWFDEFWQQHFNCTLPISRPHAADRASQVLPGQQGNQSSLCSAAQRLDADQLLDGSAFIQDQVLLTLRCVEALKLALVSRLQHSGAKSTSNGSTQPQESDDLLSHFRQKFLQVHSRRHHKEGHLPGDSVSQQMEGPLVDFQIVHRLLPASQRRPSGASLATQSSGSARKAGRPNSRQLAAGNQEVGASEAEEPLRAGQLVRVANWRSEQGLLVWLVPVQVGAEGASRRARRIRFKLPWGPGGQSSAEGAPGQQFAELEPEARQISGSLERLTGSLRSQCASKAVCSLCRQQVERSLAIARMAAGWKGATDSGRQPVALSSAALNGSLSEEQLQMLAELEPEGEPDGEQDSQTGDESAGDQVAQTKARASSLFDAATSEEVAASEMRRVLAAAAGQPQQSLWAAGDSTGSALATSGHFRHSRHHARGSRAALLGATLSLGAIALAVISMVYYYPDTLFAEPELENEQRRRPAMGHRLSGSSSSISTLGAGSLSASECELYMGGQQRGNKRAKGGHQSSLSASIMANLNDYLLLAGLLMLYSINVSFVLPAASPSLCSFRRLGLPLSFTVLFGAILSLLLHCKRNLQHFDTAHGRLRRAKQRRSTRRPAGCCLGEASAASAAGQPQLQAHLEPVDESVEVTFESLPPTSNQVEPCQDGNNLAQETYQQSSYNSNAKHESSASIAGGNFSSSLVEEEGSRGAERAAKWPIGLLVVAQLLSSALWLHRQPPEPTLSHNCWYCSSPVRSPWLFYYEPMLSLMQPFALLIASWLFSLTLLVKFNKLSSNEQQLDQERRNILNTRRHTPSAIGHRATSESENRLATSEENSHTSSSSKELQTIGRTLRALVITTSFIIVNWTLSSWTIISQLNSTINLQPSQTVWPQPLDWQHHSSSTSNGVLFSQQETIVNFHQQQLQTLVYSNIFSGAIVFLTLFLYRLRIFHRKQSVGDKKRQTDQQSCGLIFRICCCCFSASARRWTKSKTTGPQPSEWQLYQYTGSGGVAANVLKLNQQQQQQQSARARQQQSTAPTDRLFGHQLGNSRALSGDNRAADNSEQCLQQEPLQRQQFSSYGSTGVAPNGAPVYLVVRNEGENVGKETGRGNVSKQNRNQKKGSKKAEKKMLQRQRSNGSIASSTAKLVQKINSKARFAGDNLSTFSRNSFAGEQQLEQSLDDGDTDSLADGLQFDNISCAAMSVTSNSTSQLHGNELYPIDCSIQFDTIGQPSVSSSNPQDKLASS